MGTLVFQANLGGAVNLIGPNTASTVNFTLPSADGTSGQALVTNGSGTLSFSTFTSGAAGSNTQVQFNSSGAFAGSSNLTFNGTTLTAANTSVTTSETLSYGTANGVAYLNGSKVVTTGSALTFDGTNLGIGTASPASILNASFSGGAVSGTHSMAFGIPYAANLQLKSTNAGTSVSVASVGLYSNPERTKEFAFYNQATDARVGYLGYQYGSGGAITDLTLLNTLAGGLIFGTNNSEQMRLTSTGLGIGTSSPAAKLHIAGNTFRHNDATGSYGYTISAATNTTTLATLFGGSSFAIQTGASGTNQFLLDASGNLGLGVTPSAWGSSWKSLQLPNGAALSNISGLNALYLSENAVFANDQSSKYIASDFATLYQQYNGQHRWFNAPSGTAGNAITFTQAMTLTAAGRLGLGLTSPSSLFEAYGGAAGTSSELTVGNASTAARFGVDTSNEVTVATGQAVSIKFLTSNTERARIDSSGNLLVGTTSVSNQCRFTVANTNSTRTWAFGTSSTSTPFYVIDNTSGSGVQLTAGGTSWSAFSDENLKTDLAPIENAIQKVATLRAVTGRFKTDEEGVSRAFLIAQDVQAVLPEAVASTTLPGTDDETEYLSLAYTDTIPLLVAAIKELKAEFDAYKATHP